MRTTPPYVNLILFLLTVASTLFVGGYRDSTQGIGDIAWAGLPYSATLLGILVTHEMGHYTLGRIHQVDTSLPFFLPMPFGLPGTLGAVIRMRSTMPSRRAVLDIGVAGPIAGFVVAVPLLFWGFAHSEVIDGGAHLRLNAAFQCPFNILDALYHGQKLHWNDSGTSFEMGDSLITWLAARLTHGALPDTSDLQIGPVGLAAWFAMFVTTLNMTPLGQLDGGHVIYALFGKWAERVSWAFSWALFGLGFFASWSWFIWWALTRFLVGLRHPPAADETPLTPGRRVLAITSLVILAITFVPVPIYM